MLSDLLALVNGSNVGASIPTGPKSQMPGSMDVNGLHGGKLSNRKLGGTIVLATLFNSHVQTSGMLSFVVRMDF